MLRSAGAVGSAARDASAPTEGGEGREHIVAASRTACLVCLFDTSKLSTVPEVARNARNLPEVPTLRPGV